MEGLPVHGPAYGHLATPHAVAAFATLIVFVVIATLTVALRFYARRLVKSAYLPQDWMVLIALVIYYGYAISAFLSLFIGGTGWQITQLGSAEVENALKIDLVLEVTYAASMGLLKVSICLMLRNIFRTTNVRFFAIITLALSVCWSIMTILVGFLLCTPLSYNWDHTAPGGHCGNQNAAYASVSAIDILIDLIIIIIPLPSVWKLQVPNITKLALSGVFTLGLFTIAVTAVRLHTLLTVDFSDFSYSSTDIFVWTTVEWGTAIAVTCAPTFRPILEKCFPNSTFRRRGTKEDTKYNLTVYGSDHRTFNSRNPNSLNTFDRIEDYDDDELALGTQGATEVHISAGRTEVGKAASETSLTPEHNWTKSGINVENEWDVHRDSLPRYTEDRDV